ncbi:uncharacterized protein LOC143280639 [Babylonia areolata]|uniref:uncharacterized protein LOC143280639 n=1 Tax=Babylonia areolata TaxID=304850 RepID=UPI003FCF29B0
MRVTVVLALLCCLFFDVRSECIDSQGRTVQEGSDPYIGADHCNSCVCRQGMSVCTKMFCMAGNYRCMGPDHRIYAEGQSFKAEDGCNTCMCTENGSVACTEMACLQPAETTQLP